jgi:hypothetical protein
MITALDLAALRGGDRLTISGTGLVENTVVVDVPGEQPTVTMTAHPVSGPDRGAMRLEALPSGKVLVTYLGEGMCQPFEADATIVK